MTLPSCWLKRELIRHAEIMDILKDFLKVADHPVPKHTIGQLYVVGGISEAADEIIKVLVLRTIELEEKAKKKKEES